VTGPVVRANSPSFEWTTSAYPAHVELHISLDGPGDLSTRMYDQIRAAIVAGRVQPGQRLPSTRELAGRLAVSRTTVGVAFDRLLAEGFVHGRVGAGTFVSATPHPYTDERPATSPLRPRPVWDGLYEPPVMSELDAAFDFRSGVPDASHFPYSTWRALLAEQLRPGAVGSAAHIDPAGVGALRTAIARHVGVSRAVHAVADDVFVTNGSQQAVDLIARVLLEPGERVAVEDPGYPPVRGAFTAHGAQVVGVPVDSEGLVTDALPDSARLVYVTPSHQFPLGVAMSLRRRLALLAWAERTGAAIIEDDYDSEYRYGGRPLEPLHGLDHTGRVLYVGSFSKVLLPTLRLGFVVAPPPLHDALRKAKHLTDWHTQVPLQAAAARFVADGHLARHIRRMRAVYAPRHQMIQAALAGPLAAHLRVIPSAAGLHLAALLRAGGDDTAVVARAHACGVAVQPLSHFRIGTDGPQGLVLGYGAIPTEHVDEGLRRLADCLTEKRDLTQRVW
jgi:GntR family transcriptional regulator / MocR family aminotransferase